MAFTDWIAIFLYQRDISVCIMDEVDEVDKDPSCHMAFHTFKRNKIVIQQEDQK